MKSLLFRFIAKSIHMTEFLGHSAEWRSWCVYDIFKKMGFEIDVLNWKGEVKIHRTYDVIFDISNLEELSAACRPDTVKIFHLSGADNLKRNYIAQKRLDDTNKRRNGHLVSSRIIPNPEAAYRSIELADYVVLDGNMETLYTYPQRYWDKIHPVNVTASWIGWMK